MRIFAAAVYSLMLISIFATIGAAQKPPSMAAEAVERKMVKRPSVSDVKAAEQFSSDEGRFTIRMPRDVDGFAAITPAEAGQNVRGGGFRWRIREGAVFINYFDYLGGGQIIRSDADIEKFFAVSRDALLRSLSSTLISERAVTSGKYRGHEIVFDRGDGKHGFSRVFYVDGRNYTMTALCDSAIGDSEVLLARAFDTFTLLTPTAAATANPRQ